MRITKLVGTLAALVSVAPLALSAQGSGPRKIAPSGVATRFDMRELPADQQIIQALNRLTFGPKPGDALKVRAIGLDKWIDQQLHPEKIDDSFVNELVARYPALNADQRELLKQYTQQQQERRQARRADSSAMSADDQAAARRMQLQNNSRRQVVTQLQSARVARAVASERQLQEVMTDFWENHFNIYAAKGAPE